MQSSRWLPLIAIGGCYHEAPPAAAPVDPTALTCRRELVIDLSAERLVVDAHDLYVASYMGSVQRISLRERTATTFATDVNIMRLAIDDTYVYWSSLSDDRSVKRRPKSGGPIEIIATKQADPEHIAVDEHAVYWTTINGKAVMMWNKATHETTRFATGSGSIALDRTHVYWGTTKDDGRQGIGRKAKAGGDPTLVIPDGMAQMLATDGVDVYWTSAYGADVQRAPANGQATAETFSVGTAIDNAPELHAGDVVVDATHVYWEQDGVLLRRAKHGGVVEVVIPGEQSVRAFAVTADAIYWSTNHGIYRSIKAPCGL